MDFEQSAVRVDRCIWLPSRQLELGDPAKRLEVVGLHFEDRMTGLEGRVDPVEPERKVP